MIENGELHRLFESEAEAAELDWGRAPLAFTSSRVFRETITAATVEGWLDCSLLRHPYFGAIFERNPVAPDELTSPRVVGGVELDQYIDGAKARRWLSRGATMVFSNLHEWHAPAQNICRDLAATLSCKTSASIFWTGAGDSQGFPAHRDDTHVFVVQLAGRKRWSLYDIPKAPGEWKAGRTDGQVLSTPYVVDLKPGQALYVPEGQAHETRSLDGPSLHLSLTIQEPRLLDAAELAVRACVANVPKHARLGSDSGHRREAAADILGQLSRALTRLDVAELVAAVEKQTADRRGSR